MKIPCDAILLSGKVVIDESVLTGESIPVLKNEFSDEENFNNQKNINNILFSGTTVLQTTCFSSNCFALVYGTGIFFFFNI